MGGVRATASSRFAGSEINLGNLFIFIATLFFMPLTICLYAGVIQETGATPVSWRHMVSA
jgi:hypothetical protein